MYRCQGNGGAEWNPKGDSGKGALNRERFNGFSSFKGEGGESTPCFRICFEYRPRGFPVGSREKSAVVVVANLAISDLRDLRTNEEIGE